MDMDYINGSMGINIRDNSIQIKDKVQECMCGIKEGFIEVNGLQIE